MDQITIDYANTANVQQIISDAVQRHGSMVEVEIRYRDYSGIDAGVSKRTFDNVLAYMLINYRNRMQTSTYIEYIYPSEEPDGTKVNTRHRSGRTIMPDETEKPISEVTKKTSYKHKNLRNGAIFGMYNEKVVISIESKVDKPETAYKSQRRVLRRSFVFEFYKVDITKSVGDGQKKYFVELELENKGKYSDMNKFSIGELLYQIHDTQRLYGFNEFSHIVMTFNRLTRSKIEGGKKLLMDKSVIPKPRALRMDDITYGGIVGNKDTKYIATYKSDGERKILGILKNAIWLLDPPFSANKITGIRTSDYNNFLLDGELVKHKTKTKQFVFVPSDAISSPAKFSTIMDMPFDVRRNAIETVSNIINKMQSDTINPIAIHMKEYYHITEENIFSNIREMLEKKNSLSFPVDGLIFFPDGPYVPSIRSVSTSTSKKVSSIPLSERSLRFYPDICKYKPRVTVDLQVKMLSDSDNPFVYVMNKEGRSVLSRTIGLYSYGNGRLVPFIQKKHRFTLASENIPEGIHEFFLRDGALHSMKIRFDKDKPNYKDIANDNWMLMVKPIRESSITGRGFSLMRNYHSNIRQNLFDESISSYETSPCLLSIDPRDSIDYSQWEKFSKVIFVGAKFNKIKKKISPNSYVNIMSSDSMEILRGSEKKYFFIGPSINHEKTVEAVNIINGKVDVVSVMWGFSKYFKDKSKADQIIDLINSTLSPNGSLIFLSTNGRAVREMFKPTFNIRKNKMIVDTSPILLNEKQGHIELNGNDINLQYRDDISTTKLIGGLVNIDYIKSNINRNVLMKWANEERLLNEGESKITSLYCYGSFTRRSVLKQIHKKRQKRPDFVVVKYTKNVSKTYAKMPKMIISRNINVPGAKNIRIRRRGQTLANMIPPIRVTKEYEDDEVRIVGNVYLISCLGLGSSIFHCVCKAMVPSYYSNKNMESRMGIVKKLRLDISKYLKENIDKDPKLSFVKALDPCSGTIFGSKEAHGISMRIDDISEAIAGKSNLIPEYYDIICAIMRVDIKIAVVSSNGISRYLLNNKDNDRFIILSGPLRGPFDLLSWGDKMQTVFEYKDVPKGLSV